MHEGGYYARFRRLVTNGQEFSTILSTHTHTHRDRKACDIEPRILPRLAIMTFFLEGVAVLVIRFVQPKT